MKQEQEEEETEKSSEEIFESTDKLIVNSVYEQQHNIHLLQISTPKNTSWLKLETFTFQILHIIIHLLAVILSFTCRLSLLILVHVN